MPYASFDEITVYIQQKKDALVDPEEEEEFIEEGEEIPLFI